MLLIVNQLMYWCICMFVHFWQNSEKLKIDLVIEMEKLKKVHPMLEGIIMDAALNAVDALLTNVSRNYYYVASIYTVSSYF